MSMDQLPAKEFMRRMASIDKSLDDIAKSLRTLVKITNRQVPQIPDSRVDDRYVDLPLESYLDREDNENEM